MRYKRMTRLFSLILSIALVLSSISTYASPVQESTAELNEPAATDEIPGTDTEPEDVVPASDSTAVLFDMEELPAEDGGDILEVPLPAFVDESTTGEKLETNLSENAEAAEAELTNIEGNKRRSRAAVTPYASAGFSVAKANTGGGFSEVTACSSFADAKQKMTNKAAAATDALSKKSYVVLYGGRVVAMTEGIAAAIKYDQATLNFKILNGNNTGYISLNSMLYYYGTDSINSINVGVSGIKFTTSYENLLLIPAPFTSQYGTGSFAGRYEMGYYMNVGGELYHYITTLTGTTEGTLYGNGEKTKRETVVIDKAPSFMAQNQKYYSMDGVNFYTDQQLNAKAGTYYPYYQYLSYHSKTNYSAAQLNAFISYYANRYGKTSKMINSGAAFINAQNTYGVNALLEFAFACHESEYGTSSYAINRNNLFGIKAYDSDPNQASYFSSVAESVNRHADNYIKSGYLNPKTDYRYFGPHPGGKGVGINVKYASDPYHGEKIAGWAYRIDKYLGFADYELYTIGVTNTPVSVYREASASNTLYKLVNTKGNLTGVPAVIIEQSGSYYKVQSDMPIINGTATNTGAYSYNHVGYIQTSQINRVRESNQGKWSKIDGKWYFVKPDGTYHTGWLFNAGKWYYLNSSGVMQTGWAEVNGTWYYLNSSGAMQTGWTKVGAYWYYMSSSGAMQKGWLQIGSTWYYLSTNTGAMLTGWVTVGTKKYYMNSSGAMQKGWLKQSNGWYYLDGSGAMRTGWASVGGKWYYLNGDGVMQTGWVTVGGKRYFLNSSGAMQKGWLKQSNGWYYLDGSGAMRTGWASVGGKWYYLNGSGVMQTGWASVGGKWYYLNGSGAMQKGWLKSGSTWYYLNASGAMVTGWASVGGKWYYLNGSGAMQKGWLKLGSTWYYLNASGAMQKGWLKLGNTWYYLNSSGAMQTGWVKVGNTQYYLNSSGAWTGQTK